MSDFIHILVDLPLIVLVLLKITMVLGLGWMVHFFLTHRNPHWRVLLWRCIITGIFLVPALLPLKYMQFRVASSPQLPTVSRPDSSWNPPDRKGCTPVLRRPAPIPRPIPPPGTHCTIPDWPPAAPIVQRILPSTRTFVAR